ncbi:YheC/YheD family protein [Paenibacillus sp. PL91]|uniref:YheC/YheD family endospore coat-associated protein n=1 Tax=Paenibacillus sp. PL91 TaxID=2729538 RepID=UPI00145D92ED|nr:YheC/YheD family protein [Paenibacillus sp. PL91]MBC9203055.1 YheC/YheD family protein [Paenibacillus sp. PL91]
MNNILGIMTHRIMRPENFTRHARSAIAEKFEGVIIYTPKDVNLQKRQIHGCVYQSGGWTRKTVPYPKINMDIGFYPPALEGRASLVKKSKQLRFTGYGLGNKCKIQSHLVGSSVLKPHLLPTEKINSSQQFIQFLKKHEIIMVKPINGWGGRGIIKVTLEKERFVVQRDGAGKQSLPIDRLDSYIRGVLKSGRHLMQKWIDIRNKNGKVYDIRALMQKKDDGEWVMTGMAVREGMKNKITSNIKSGGDAYKVAEYLEGEQGSEEGEALTKSIVEVAEYIPDFVEKSYNSRLSELGIDLAVDRSGKLWLIEINIKPGKMIIKRLYGKKAWEQCLHIPFHYARNLLEKK